ncbi:Polyprotein P3 [Dictyocoela muelleri]|nr:Polyprotein P3 [Dictyocoela muelleri]
MHPSSQKYTAFCLENEKFKWLRMPFGLSNAPRTFQRAIVTIFSKLSFVKIYLDDIIIHSKNKDDHANHLKTDIQLLTKITLRSIFKNMNYIKVKLDFWDTKYQKI